MFLQKNGVTVANLLKEVRDSIAVFFTGAIEKMFLSSPQNALI